VNNGASLSDEGAGLSVIYRPIKTIFLTNASRFPKDIFFGGGGGRFQASSCVLLERGIKMSIGHWWNGIDRIKPNLKTTSNLNYS
jgi:hypothetical protein